MAACAPSFAPQGAETVPLALTTDAYITHDGLKLPLRRWDAKAPKAIIIALHGMSDYSNAFALPAPVLAARGISVIAYDQRSFGQSPNPGLWPGAAALRADFTAFVNLVRANNPGLPVFALGESMGGAVVLSSLAETSPPKLDGVILVAPAVWSRGDMPLSYRVALWAAAHFLRPSPSPARA